MRHEAGRPWSLCWQWPIDHPMRQIRGSAFQLLEEALLFCQRHLPLPGRIEPGRLERMDRPLIPPEALRGILVNALIHRDCTIAGGAVALAIFDDRVEIWSAGRLPTEITPDDLSYEHDSIQRDPVIAEVFYRAGLIKKWGGGTEASWIGVTSEIQRRRWDDFTAYSGYIVGAVIGTPGCPTPLSCVTRAWIHSLWLARRTSFPMPFELRDFQESVTAAAGTPRLARGIASAPPDPGTPDPAPPSTGAGRGGGSPD